MLPAGWFVALLPGLDANAGTERDLGRPPAPAQHGV